MALLLRYDIPTSYVSRELLAAALRTGLPDDITFEAIPFPFDALVFMLPKGSVRHPTEGDCPFLVLSRTSKGQALSLPTKVLDFSVIADQNAVLVTTYMPEAALSTVYYKSVPVIPGATIEQAFLRASSVAFSLIVNDELADNEEGVDLSAEDFVDKLISVSQLFMTSEAALHSEAERVVNNCAASHNSAGGHPALARTRSWLSLPPTSREESVDALGRPESGGELCKAEAVLLKMNIYYQKVVVDVYLGVIESAVNCV